MMEYTSQPISLLSSGNAKKSTYEPRTEAISPVINDDLLNAEDFSSRSTKNEQMLIVEKLKKIEAEILQTDLQIVRLRRQKEQLEQAANNATKEDDDQENVCDTKQLSIAKMVYHENRAKVQRAHAKLDCLGGITRILPMYNQPTDNEIYHHNAAKFNYSFKASLVSCFRTRLANRLKLEESVSAEYNRRMEKWLKSIEIQDSEPGKRIQEAKTREFFERQFPELKKARENVERFARVGQRVARSDAEVAELLDGIIEREDQDKKMKSYAVIPPMLEEMRSRKPKFINRNGFVEDVIAEYKKFQILNTWTDEEKEIFKENYLQHPKDFALISRMTNRKNVSNCVHYYYLSKKNENFKQLLKRQQKRRTRSFVRPAQATPAQTSVAEPDDSKPQILESVVQVCICCVCGKTDQENQFRNVTKSNHQIYGIGIDMLKPGLKICCSCRFRHVENPSSPGDRDQMDLSNVSNKGVKRACVRDIIYQAIEMSFQKQETTEPSDAQPKIEPRPDCTAPLTQPIMSIVPPQPIRSLPGSIDTNIRAQQYNMPIGIQQQQQQQQHIRQPTQQQHQQLRPLCPLPARPLTNSGIEVPMSRLTGPNSTPHFNPISSAMQPPPAPQTLLTTVVPISSPHTVPVVRHQSIRKPHPNTFNHVPPGAHSFNPNRKYNDTAFPLTVSAKQPQEESRPPAAHWAKVGVAAGSMHDGVLNLSAKQAPESAKQNPSTNPQSDLTNSQSPIPIGSPTSPSAMVIDESAETQDSPSEYDDEENINR